MRVGGAFVLAVGNRKGGTGKTTTSVNLAAEVAARGLDTLLIDLDTQGHAAVGLGVAAPAKGEPTVHCLFDGRVAHLRDAIVPTGHDRLSMVRADPLYDGIGGNAQPTLIAQRLRDEGLLDAYRLIVIDTPPSLDPLLMNAVAAANGMLVPLTPHPLGMDGVRQLTRLLFRIGGTVNPDLRLIGLLPIMLDLRIRLHLDTVADMERGFGANRVLNGVRADIKLAEAFRDGKPIRDYAPRSRGAVDYAMLADDLIRGWALG
ncbi:MAG: ParA family protein [Alphaproteobacteria bacterium]|nr:ParA family protein [Alphaproteobacteria bacterium]